MDFDLDLDFHVFNFRPHRLFDEPYLLGWKLQNSNCDKQMIEEILRISKGIYKRRRHISSFCYLDLYSRYITVIENLKSSEEPEWNEVKEELQQILQEVNERRINRIESADWQKVFKTLSQRMSETKILDLLDDFQIIKANAERKYVFSRRGVVNLTPVYEMWRQTILQHAETMDFMEIKKSLKDLLRLIEKRRDQTICVNVEKLDGEEYILGGLRETDTVGILTDRIEKETGIPRNKFALEFNGNLLKQNQYMKTYGICDWSNIQLLPDIRGQGQPKDLQQIVYGMINSFKGQIMNCKEQIANLKGQVANLYRKFPQYVLDCTRILTDMDFVKISPLVCGMKFLGVQLGLDAVTCDQIEYDSRNERQRIFEMLREWRQKDELEATVENLLSAIKESKVPCEFEKLKRAICLLQI